MALCVQLLDEVEQTRNRPSRCTVPPHGYPMHRSALLLLLAATACTPNSQPPHDGAPPPDTHPTNQNATWLATVRAQAEAGSYRFVADGARFQATNRAHGLVTRMDGPTVAVTRGEGTVALQVVEWGAEGALVTAERPTWAAGTCVASGAVDPTGDCVRRLAGARSGLTEWWENGPNGLEQGFRVDRPAGRGDLLVDLAIDGATVTLGAADAALLTLPDGSTLRYDGLVAFDADGRTLPARMETREGGLRLRVDPRGAAWPVVIDPVISSWWSIIGEEASTHLGFAVDGVGDVNGDGWDDILVGGYGAELAWLHYGSATGPRTTPDWIGASPGGSYGHAVAGLGDVNGDGYADFAVGAPEEESGQPNEGLVHVYLGSPSGPAPTADALLQPDAAQARFGMAVDSAGDVNGDGFDDVVVGAQWYETKEGTEGGAWVFLGSASGVITPAVWSVEATSSEELGTRVAGLGDVDGDGFADIAVSAPRLNTTQSRAGAVFVYRGGPSGPATTASWSYLGAAQLGQLGLGLAGPGDINGDGYADLLAGEPFYEGSDRREGHVLLFSGSAAGLSPVPTWTFETNLSTGSELGAALAGGDVNGDGYADVILGDERANFYNGAVHVFYGSSAGLPPTIDYTHLQRSTLGLGAVVAVAGDTDGDGFAEVLMSAPDAGTDQQGQVRLAFGSATVPAERGSYTWSLLMGTTSSSSRIARPRTAS